MKTKSASIHCAWCELPSDKCTRYFETVLCAVVLPGQGRRHRQAQVLLRGVVIVLTTCALFVNSSTSAQVNTNQPVNTQTSAAQPDYSAFNIITERNIFAARRSGRVTRSTAPRPQRRVETFTLVGTLEAGNGPVAFFDGTSFEYRKAAKPGDRIAAFTVTKISFKGVLLQDEHQRTIELKVGAQMRLQDDGQWQAPGTGEFIANVTTESAHQTSSTTANAGEPGSDDTVNEVLKRLMQQREQELQ